MYKETGGDINNKISLEYQKEVVLKWYCKDKISINEIKYRLQASDFNSDEVIILIEYLRSYISK